MERAEKWLYANTTLDTVLRMRPMALTWLERHHIDPWASNRQEVGDICESLRMSLPDFLAEMNALPEPGPDTDWKGSPVHFLLDYLCREHRQFLRDLLPAIKQTLNREPVGDGESLRRLRNLVTEWPAFGASLEEHIYEEESFLFPRIMHYDYCLRHDCAHSDFHGGSVNVYVALRMLGNEKRQMAAIRRFLNEVLFSQAAEDRPGSLEERLRPLLEDLQFRHLNHSWLETNVLFPMAKSIEKNLMDRSISGLPAKPAAPSVPEASTLN